MRPFNSTAFVVFAFLLLALCITVLVLISTEVDNLPIAVVASFAAAFAASWALAVWSERRRSDEGGPGPEEVAAQLARERAQARHYEAILQQMTDAVMVVDADGRVKLVNRAFSRLFGTEPEDAEGRALESATLNYQVSALINRALRQATTQRDRVELSHPRPHALEGIATSLKDDEGGVIGAVALLHDITRLEQADRVRQDFVANASHELRTPAAGIKALAEALQAGAIDDPVRGREFCEQIVDAADRLADILSDMLTLTRVERGDELLEPRSISAADALEEALAQVRPAAEAKEIALEGAVDEEDKVFADPDALQTLLVNLLDNAVKYTPEGGAVIARGMGVEQGYRFEVADTGPGIPLEDQERIFERFYRVDRARSRQTGSTGLGLAIVKHIAEAHGGRVGLSSEPGDGSTFTVVLPSAPAEPARSK